MAVSFGRAVRRIFVAVLLVASIATGFFIDWYVRAPLNIPGDAVRFAVEEGNGLNAVARRMHEQGLVRYPRVLALFARLEGLASRLHTGEYELRRGMSPRDALMRIVRGDSIREEIRLIEGWTFAQIRAAIDGHPGLRHDSTGLGETEILERVGAIEKSPEGLFFPDSYHFAAGSSDFSILRVAYARMRSVLDAEWATRDPTVPLASPYEALILASVVEKETGHAADRPHIAAVFSNRLRIGMRLQSDPTVIYGLGPDFDGNLRRIDLERDTPYNTYTRAGLPPTPICSPGAASIEAVVRPPHTKDLYFVARGDGTSEFSDSLDEHNRAVNRYQKR
ncbi:MAG: endolytic transglycosylase MltG [Betaproteobacteria bacterium]|nr:endolytic transglycosylase MltG [Betaproteobacteria bacterium]